MGYTIKDLTIIEAGDAGLCLKKETYTKQNRKCHVAVLKNTNGGACTCKGEALSEGEAVVAVEFTYDPETFTVMCVPCATHFQIVGEAGDSPAPVKATPTVKKKAKAADKSNEEKNDMAVDLKSKLAPKAGAKAEPKSEPKKPLLVEEEDEEEETEETDDEAPEEEEEEDEAPVKKPAKTPIVLKQKVRDIDSAPHVEGLTKDDVAKIVDACLLEFEKRIALKFKEVRVDYTKGGATILDTIEEKLSTRFDTLTASIEKMATAIAKAPKAPAAEETAKPEPAAEEAPVKRGPGRPPGAKNKGAEEKPATKPTGKRPKMVDFINDQMTEDGLDLENLGDVLATMGYFPGVTPDVLAEYDDEEKEGFLADLTGVLVGKGFSVDDGIVTAN